MKVLLLSSYFPPEIGSASHLFYELGESLVQLGHRVDVVTGFPRYNIPERPTEYRGKFIMREQMAGMNIYRMPVLSMPRRIMLGRAIDHFFAAFSFFMGGLLAGPHDAVMVYSPPLPLGLLAKLLSILRRSKFVLNVQDIFPQSIIDLGLLKNEMIIRMFRRIERFLYQTADAVTVHSSGNFDHIQLSGGGQDNTHVISNWVDTDMIRPGERSNGFRKEFNIGDEFIVSFAGVLGYSQALDSVIATAEKLRSEEDILFLIVGDGVEKESLVSQKEDLRLMNVRFLPMQPKEVYPSVLAASDVCLVTLKKDVQTPVVPSKIPTIMAAGRPMIASMPLDGDGPKLVKEASCGIIINPEDPGALAEAILDLYKSADLRQQLSESGRRYAEENLSRENCVSQYEKVLKELITEKLDE
jgi:glycosyltransferase involved in cell wall biosynthesis